MEYGSREQKKGTRGRVYAMLVVMRRLLGLLSQFVRERKILVFAGSYIISLWIVASLLFQRFEGVSLFDAFYWVVTTTATVGYGDIVATTTVGKLMSIFVMISGIGVLGLLLVTFTDFFIEQSLKRRHLLRSFMEQHIIVCGWDKRLEIAAKELLAAEKELVVVAEVDDLPLERKHLLFIKGDPSDDENLKRANVARASYALIAGRTDTETLLSAIAVKKLNPGIHTTCIVSDPKVIQALKKTGVDQTISTDGFLGLLLSRSVFVPKISTFVNELLDIQGMDLYQERISEELEGQTFLEVVELFKQRYDVIPVGLVRNNKVNVNPGKELKLQKNDELLYIAEDNLGISASK
jgi:voltage-gated potassium channel